MNIKYKMNKKGFALTVGMIVAGFLAIVFLTFFAGGGISTVFNISKFIKAVPTFIWVIFGVVIVLRIIGGRRRK